MNTLICHSIKIRISNTTQTAWQLETKNNSHTNPLRQPASWSPIPPPPLAFPEPEPEPETLHRDCDTATHSSMWARWTEMRNYVSSSHELIIMLIAPNETRKITLAVQTLPDSAVLSGLIFNFLTFWELVLSVSIQNFKSGQSYRYCVLRLCQKSVT